MQNLLLYRARQLPNHFCSRRTQIAFAVILFVLGMHLVMALSAMTMTLHVETVPASAVARSFQRETEAAGTNGMPCCTPAMVSLCPQLCVAEQATAAVTLQTPAVATLSFFLADVLFRTGNIRTPTPPPRA